MSMEEKRVLDWKESIVANFVLFGYLLAPPALMQEYMRSRSKKLLLLAVLNIIGTSALVALGLVSALDGFEVARGLLTGNFTMHSQTLLTWGIYTFLFFFAIIAGIGFLLPFLLNLLLNLARYKKNRKRVYDVFISSSYGLLVPLFFTPMIYVVTIYANWQVPFLHFLMDEDWSNGMLYAFAALLLFGIISYGVSQWKMLGFQWWRSMISPTIMFFALAMVVLLFVT